MALVLASASSQGLSIGSAPDYNAAYTFILWVNPTTLTGDPTPLTISQDGFDYDQMYVNAGGAFIFRASIDGGGVADATGGSASTSTWYCVVGRRDSATSHSALLGTTPANIALGQTVSHDITGRGAANQVDAGSFRGSSNFWNGAVAAGFLYPSALTLDEIKAQAAYAQAVHASPWGAWPMRRTVRRNQARDTSGNTRNLTIAGGLLTEAADPDITGWPAEVPRTRIAL